MSAGVSDQRMKGQGNQVINSSSKNVVETDDRVIPWSQQVDEASYENLSSPAEGNQSGYCESSNVGGGNDFNDTNPFKIKNGNSLSGGDDGSGGDNDNNGRRAGKSNSDKSWRRQSSANNENDGMFGQSFGQQSSYNYFPKNGDYNAWGSQQMNSSSSGSQHQQHQQQHQQQQQQQQQSSRKGNNYDDAYYNRSDRNNYQQNDSIKTVQRGMQNMGLDSNNDGGRSTSSNSTGNNAKSTSTGTGGANQASAVPKQLTWASVASQPAKPTLRTSSTSSTLKKKGPGMPPPPMVPGKHNMDIGTWDSPKNGSILVPPPVIPVPIMEPSPLSQTKSNSGTSTSNNITNNSGISSARGGSTGPGGNESLGPSATAGGSSSIFKEIPPSHRQQQQHQQQQPPQQQQQQQRGDHYQQNQKSHGGPNNQSQPHHHHHNNQNMSGTTNMNQQQQQNIRTSWISQTNPPAISKPMQSSQYPRPNVNHGQGSSSSSASIGHSNSGGGYHHSHGSSSEPQLSQQQSQSVPQAIPRPPLSISPTLSNSSSNHPVLDELKDKNNYNPPEFDISRTDLARFFVIKSYSEDDIHRSIKYEIWCSTEHGNKRLDQAYRERKSENGTVFLFFSVNGSRHFCGMAQMMTPVDYNCVSDVWSQDKWKGSFKVKWIYVKDVPNSLLRNIRLENNEDKSVTHSRDTQEVPKPQGQEVLKIMHAYKHRTSIFDDFFHYEQRQEEARKLEAQGIIQQPPPPQQQQQQGGGNSGGGNRGGSYNSHRDRDVGRGEYDRGSGSGSGGGYDKGNYSLSSGYREKSYGRGGGGYHTYDNRRNDDRGSYDRFQRDGGGRESSGRDGGRENHDAPLSHYNNIRENSGGDFHNNRGFHRSGDYNRRGGDDRGYNNNRDRDNNYHDGGAGGGGGSGFRDHYNRDRNDHHSRGRGRGGGHRN